MDLDERVEVHTARVLLKGQSTILVSGGGEDDEGSTARGRTRRRTFCRCDA